MTNPDYTSQTSRELRWTSRDVRSLSSDRLIVLKNHLVGHTVLEIGCAQGAYAFHISSLGYSVIGSDLSNELLATAGLKYPTVEFVVSDCMQSSFADKCFDNVVVFDVLEHVDDEVALKEICRICRNRVIISVPLQFCTSLGRHGLIYWHYQDRTHLRYYTRDHVHNLFDRHRINIVHECLVDPVELKDAFIDALFYPSLIKRIIGKMVRCLRLRIDYQTLIVVGQMKNG